MAFDPSFIVAGQQRAQPISFTDSLAKLGGLRLQQQQGHLNQLLIRDREQDLANQQTVREQEARTRADQEALRSGFNDPSIWELGADGVKTPNRAKLQAVVPGHLWPAVAASFQKQDEETAKTKKAMADARESQAKAQQAADDTIGAAFAGVAAAGYAPGSFAAHLDTLKANEIISPQAASMLAAKGKDPESIKGVVTEFLASSKTQRELGNTAAGHAETGRHNLVTEGQGAAGLTRQDAAQREAARHNRATEAEANARLAQSAGDKTELTAEGLDAAALMFSKTGQLPSLGMGDKTTRKAIINRAAALTPGLDLASAKADFGANSESLKGLQKQRDALGAFEATAIKNLDVFLNLAAKVPDTGSPALNQPLRHASERMFGGDTLTAYNTARRTVIPEFAKILANPGLSGQLSDSARKEIEEVVSGSATLKQTIAAAKVLKQDTENRRTSYDDQIAAIQQRIGKATAPAAAGRARVIGPNGQTGTVPAGTSLPDGWRLQ